MVTWRMRTSRGRRPSRGCVAARVLRVGWPEVFNEDSNVQCEGARRRREKEGGETFGLREEPDGAMCTRD